MNRYPYINAYVNEVFGARRIGGTTSSFAP